MGPRNLFPFPWLMGMHPHSLCKQRAHHIGCESMTLKLNSDLQPPSTSVKSEMTILRPISIDKHNLLIEHIDSFCTSFPKGFEMEAGYHPTHYFKERSLT